MTNIRHLPINQNWYRTFLVHLGGRGKNWKSIAQGCTNPGRQLAMATTFYMVAPSLCGSSVWTNFTSPSWRLEFCDGSLPRSVRFQPDSPMQWPHNLHETYQLPRVQLITPDDGHSRCPKHVEFRDKIKFWVLDGSCWLFIWRWWNVFHSHNMRQMH